MDHNTVETEYPVRYSMEDPIAGYSVDEKGALHILNEVCSEIETIVEVEIKEGNWVVKSTIPYIGYPDYKEMLTNHYRGVKTVDNHLHLHARVKVTRNFYDRVMKFRSDRKWALSFLIEQALKEYLKGYLEELSAD